MREREGGRGRSREVEGKCDRSVQGSVVWGGEGKGGKGRGKVKERREKKKG